MPDVISLLGDLVAFPSISSRSNLDIIAYIEDYLGTYGIESRRVEGDERNKASLFARIGPAASGGVVLSGHTDVVPVDGQDWTVEPFSLSERDGKLFGRGTCDMKGFLACCLHALPAVLEGEIRKPVYLAFSHDEEVGCRAAPALIRALQDYYPEKPAFALIGEPTGMKPVLGQKGIAMLHTVVSGSEGHSSMVRQSVSAVHVAARLITWIEDYMENRVANGKTDARFHPPSTTLHVGKVAGGQAGNIIANRCSFTWDIRSIPGERAERIINDFQAYCDVLEAELKQRFAGAAIRTELFHPPVPALDTPRDSTAARWIERLSGSPATETVAFGTEAGQFSEAGIPAVICGPGSIHQAHRADEFISRKQLEAAAGLLLRLADQLAKA